jgi:hypothetical protein
MTIFRIYADNGNRAGFWVQHRTWTNTCAQVQSIAGQRTGKLPGDTTVPGSTDVIIRGFDVRSGRPVPLTPALSFVEDRNYSLIAVPGWYRGAPEPVDAAE